MPRPQLTRRFLKLPAIIWVAASIGLVILARSLPARWPPEALTEPTERQEIFREGILITPEGDSFRFVPLADSKTVKPLWAVNTSVRRVSRSKWSPVFLGMGLFYREANWNYELAAHRFDDEWQRDKSIELSMPIRQAAALKPLVVRELNQRQSGLGDRLDKLLAEGVEVRSDWCLQNAVTWAAWLSMPLAGAAAIFMFVPAKQPPVAAVD